MDGLTLFTAVTSFHEGIETRVVKLFSAGAGGTPHVEDPGPVEQVKTAARSFGVPKHGSLKVVVFG